MRVWNDKPSHSGAAQPLLPIFFGALASTHKDFLPLSLTFAHRAFISSAILFLVAAENRRRDLGAAD
jgi:hypothetical protein